MRYPNAASGLRLMFIGQILMILGILLAWVPLVGGLLIIASPAAQILGLYKAGDDDENYRGALVFAVLILVVGLFISFTRGGFFEALLSMADEVLNLLLVFSVCNTTGNLLHSIGQESLSQRGGMVVKIFTACTAVSIVCRVLGIIPIINIAAALVAGVSSLVMVAGYVMYLLFLNSSSRVL